MEELVSSSVAQPRLTLWLLVAFALLALTRAMSSLLFETQPRDPLTLGLAAAILACVAMAT